MIKISNYNFAEKKAIVRVDFNVPLNKQTLEVTDDTRIRGALPTIQKIINDGGSAILMSHLGRPSGVEAKYSLKPVVAVLSKLLGGKEIKFADDCMGDSTKKMVASLKPGENFAVGKSTVLRRRRGKTSPSRNCYRRGEKSCKDSCKGKTKRIHQAASQLC